TVLALTGAQMVAVMLDREGAVLLTEDMPPYRAHEEPCDAAPDPGIGNAFSAAMALALAAPAEPRVAFHVAWAAASLVGSDDAATSPTQELLRAQLAHPHSSAPLTPSLTH